jgi:hypothetical protein
MLGASFGIELEERDGYKIDKPDMRMRNARPAFAKPPMVNNSRRAADAWANENP